MTYVCNVILMACDVKYCRRPLLRIVINAVIRLATHGKRFSYIDSELSAKCIHLVSHFHVLDIGNVILQSKILPGNVKPEINLQSLLMRAWRRV